MDNAAEDVEAVKKSLVELAENAWADKSFHGKVSFKPSQKLKEKIKELIGHDISEVFITADNMRHLRNHHGEAEEKRGQVNFKPEMAGEIYDVVNDFDSATKERNDNKGNQNVLVVRKGNGDSFALLVERGKKKAEVKTFYKKTKTPLMSDAKSPNLNAQSDSVKSSVTSSVSQEQENVERENSDTNVLKGVEGLWESTINDYIDRGFVIESYKGHKEGKKLVYDLTFESEQERQRFIDDYYEKRLPRKASSMMKRRTRRTSLKPWASPRTKPRKYFSAMSLAIPPMKKLKYSRRNCRRNFPSCLQTLFSIQG